VKRRKEEREMNMGVQKFLNPPSSFLFLFDFFDFAVENSYKGFLNGR
jgi:hypothetical protein